MSIYLPYGVERLLPPSKEINASLLMNKYGNVKTAGEKENSAKYVERVVEGKTYSKPRGMADLPRSVSIVMKLEDRLIVDAASGTVDHANLCLHPHFGVPMIPGSAVKGATRHFLWEQWNEAVGEGKKVKADLLVALFGYPTGDDGLDEWCLQHLSEKTCDEKGKKRALAGKITFFAAMPCGHAPLEVDVLTCHHMAYYSPTKDKKVATDDEEPNPQFFPAVKKGASFEFVVCPTSRGTQAMAQQAMGLLQQALETNGIGAKTAAGYGWFSEDVELKAQREKAEQEVVLNTQVDHFLQGNAALKEQLLNEGEFAEVVGRVLESGSDDEKMVLVALLKTEKSNYLKKQQQQARKGKSGPQKRVDAILALMDELEGLFQ